MPFNDYEQDSLMNLLTALQGGMDPSVASQFLGSTMTGMQERVDERREMMRGLTDLLAQQAMAGQSQSGASALADAYTPRPGVPPRIERALGALYPEQNIPAPQAMLGDMAAPHVQANQGMIDQFAGFLGVNAQAPQQAVQQMQATPPTPVAPEQLQSPAFQQDPMAGVEQQLAQTQLAQSQMELAQMAQEPSPQQVVDAAVQSALLVARAQVQQGALPPDQIYATMLSSSNFAELDPITQQAVAEALQKELLGQGAGSPAAGGINPADATAAAPAAVGGGFNPMSPVSALPGAAGAIASPFMTALEHVPAPVRYAMSPITAVPDIMGGLWDLLNG